MARVKSKPSILRHAQVGDNDRDVLAGVVCTVEGGQGRLGGVRFERTQAPAAQHRRAGFGGWSALSSTISALLPWRVQTASSGLAEGRETPTLKRTVKMNVLPLPGVLSTRICPPISSTSCLADRQAEAGAAVLAGGRRVGLGEGARRAGPRPPARCRCRCRRRRMISSTTSSPALALTLTRTTTSPRSVNLMALPTRLTQHLAEPVRVADERIRHVGVDVAGELELLAAGAERPASSRASLDDLAEVESRPARARCLPASILEKSRMSLIRSRAAHRAERLDGVEVLALLGGRARCPGPARSCR